MDGEGIERRRLRVYLAGPISKGDVWENIYLGLKWGRALLKDGFAPYIPHLDAYLTLHPGTAPENEPDQWKSLLEWDLEWVKVSEAVLRLPGVSTGADLECERAESEGIPVFRLVQDDVAMRQWDQGYMLLTDFANLKDLRGVRL